MITSTEQRISSFLQDFLSFTALSNAVYELFPQQSDFSDVNSAVCRSVANAIAKVLYLTKLNCEHSFSPFTALFRTLTKRDYTWLRMT
jgi:hypothetical protein